MPTQSLTKTDVFLENKLAYPVTEKNKAAPLANDKSDAVISTLNFDASAPIIRVKERSSLKTVELAIRQKKIGEKLFA